MSDDDVLSRGWKMFQVPALGDEPEDEPVSTEGLDIKPGDMALGTKNRVLVVIRSDGTLNYGPGYTPDEAAQVFWAALARKRVEHEETLALHRHLEALAIRIGEADLDNEKARYLAGRAVGTSTGGASAIKAFEAHALLEHLVHQMVELGRSLAELKRGSGDPSNEG